MPLFDLHRNIALKFIAYLMFLSVIPLLALGYAAGIALLMRSSAAARVLMAFAPVGRMALGLPTDVRGL